MTGSIRFISSATEIVKAPGRVLSPPISIKFAPFASINLACFKAASNSI